MKGVLSLGGDVKRTRVQLPFEEQLEAQHLFRPEWQSHGEGVVGYCFESSEQHIYGKLCGGQIEIEGNSELSLL